MHLSLFTSLSLSMFFYHTHTSILIRDYPSMMKSYQDQAMIFPSPRRTPPHYMDVYGGFLKWGYPQSSSIYDGFFIVNHLEVPPLIETSTNITILDDVWLKYVFEVPKEPLPPYGFLWDNKILGHFPQLFPLNTTPAPRPSRHRACAPRATALKTSPPRRTPPSMNTAKDSCGDPGRRWFIIYG